MPDIAPRDKTQRADHEDANPGAEVAAIQSYQKNACDCDGPHRDCDVRMHATTFVASNQDRPQHNNNSGH